MQDGFEKKLNESDLAFGIHRSEHSLDRVNVKLNLLLSTVRPVASMTGSQLEKNRTVPIKRETGF